MRRRMKALGTDRMTKPDTRNINLKVAHFSMENPGSTPRENLHHRQKDIDQLCYCVTSEAQATLTINRCNCTFQIGLKYYPVLQKSFKRRSWAALASSADRCATETASITFSFDCQINLIALPTLTRTYNCWPWLS